MSMLFEVSGSRGGHAAMFGAALLGVALAGCWPAPLGAQTLPPYGVLVNAIDHTTPSAAIAARMEKAREMNASWVRVDFSWYTVERTRGALDWAYFDTLVQEADSRGLRIIAMLGWTPAWAVTSGPAYYGVPDMRAWETFVFNTVARYRGIVDIWEIWNEPDKPYYWRGTPGQYAELLARAYTKIRAADPEASVALGGLAQGGSSLVVDFLEQILDDPTYPAGRHFDLHNIHTNFRTPGMIAAQIQNNRAILATYGLQKAIIATEASYTSDPLYQTLPGYVGGGQTTQARYLADAFEAMIANGISVAVWATLVNYPNGTGPYAWTGLTRTDLRAKEAYQTLRELASVDIDAETDSAESTTVATTASYW